MKKLTLIFLFGISTLVVFAQKETKISGKIVDENLSCLFGVKVKNLSSGAESESDRNGRFEIIAKENDKLIFQMIGLSNDTLQFQQSIKNINLIMMDKDVNCLGAIWTERQYRKANNRIKKHLKNLYKKAEEQNVWKKSSC